MKVFASYIHKIATKNNRRSGELIGEMLVNPHLFESWVIAAANTDVLLWHTSLIDKKCGVNKGIFK